MQRFANLQYEDWHGQPLHQGDALPSYNNRNFSRFHYLLFGIVFGLCFPLLAATIEMAIGNNLSLFEILVGKTNRLMPIIDSAPVILGFVFYWVGLKQEKISELYLRRTKSDLEKNQSLLEAAERIGRYGNWELDLTTMKSTWSKGLYAIFQMDPSEDAPELTSFMSRVLLADQPLVQQVMRDVLENGKREFTTQFHVKLKDGSVRTVRGHGGVLVNHSNTPIKMFGTAQDITELDFAQKEAQFYKQAIDQSAIVAITDRSGIITHANDNFCSISGYKKEELIGKTHSLLNSGVMGSDFFRDMWESISSGKIWRGEICNRAKNGGLYWVDTAIVPFVGINGRPESYVAIRSDITKRKTSEVQILQAHQRLEMAEDIGRIGSVEFDERRQNFRCSKGIFGLLHLSKDTQLSYQTFSDFIEVSDRNIFEPAIDQSILSRQQFSCSFRVNLGGGVQRWLHAGCKPIFSSDSKFEKMLVSLQDVTEKVQSDQHLIEATNKAELASKTKATFLANMSHEIRTPMNGIIGMTNLLLGSTDNQDHINKLRIIQNCGNNLLDLINDILDFSKLEVDKLELENEPFALNDSVNEIVELLNTRASEKGVLLSYFPDADIPPWVKGDVTRFRQIVTNLVGNAIKFTEKGSVTISSKIAKKTEGQSEFQFSVRDTGVGIPDEVKNKLFQSFSQIDASTTRKFGGTGLGLAITKGICEKIGGTVWVESELGKGSTFIFTFKAQVADEVKSAPPSANPFAAVDPEMGKKKPLNILVTEDNRVNQLVIVGLLGKLGYQADVASNGLEALSNLKMKPYDLILMDCHMPLMDGFEASERIVAEYPSNRPRIVAVTASTMKEDIDHCLMSGMDGFIGKPITIPALLKALNECTPTSTENSNFVTEKIKTVSSLEPFDKKTFFANFQDMEDLARDTISSFLDSLPKMISAIEQAISTSNSSELEIAAHTLKGAVSNFYAEPSRSLAWQLEQLGHDSSVEGSKEILEKLMNELQSLKTALYEVLGKRVA